MTLSSVKNLAPWAELCVLRGAPARRLSFLARAPAHHIFGSSEGASLRFVAPGVAPHHFDLIWDGANAWLEDPLRLGRTTVNGRTLNEWVPVLHSAVIVFGTVSLGIRTESASEAPRAPNFDALERARLFQSGPIRRRDTLRVSAVLRTGTEK